MWLDAIEAPSPRWSHVSCPNDAHSNPIRLERTIKEWELRDINGDGYPDFVYNALLVDLVAKPPSTPGTFIGQIVEVYKGWDFTGSTDVKALINMTGVHLTDGAVLFTSPIILELGGTDGCGVARWEVDLDSASPGLVNQICGFEDVNGDGIADRVTSVVQDGALVTRAALGTGDVNHPFSTAATITLPGPLSRTQADLVAAGPDGPFRPRDCLPSSEVNNNT